MIRALLFDFDGLILDTESASLQSWQETYAEYGFELTLEQWQDALGRESLMGFDPIANLARLLGTPLDDTAIYARRQARKQQLCEDLELLPGVRGLLDQADALGLPCAVASSSGREWVESWLRRHGIWERFRCVRTVEDVEHAKPAPDLFLSAAACLGVAPAACLVFEDSPNGIRAGQAAGMRCVAVPCALTAQLVIPPCDVRLETLAGCDLAALIRSLD